LKSHKQKHHNISKHLRKNDAESKTRKEVSRLVLKKSVIETEGSPDELIEGDNGTPPEIPIGVTVDLFTVQVVHTDTNAPTIIGFHILVANSVVSAKRL